MGMSPREPEFGIGKKRAKVPLPLLARVQIASPCDARWDEMSGDARVRHCAACDKDVFDLSEMTSEDAEALLARDTGSTCVRTHRRADGTVITSDCPVGATKKRRRRWLAAGAAVAGSVMAAAATYLTHTTQADPCAVSPPDRPHAMMGAIAVMPPPMPTPPMAPPAPMMGRRLR